MLAAIIDKTEDLIWAPRFDAATTPVRWLVRASRYLYALVRDMIQGHLTLRAMSLVYTTLLSMVPLIAFSFSVLKGFGVHRQAYPWLYNMLEPLGPRGAEVTDKIINFVDNIDVKTLGLLGLMLLLYTVIALIGKVENGFNFIWRVGPSSNYATRFSAYLSVILIGPLLMLTALGITASITNNVLVQKLLAIEPFGSGIVALSKLMPYVLVTSAFTFLYVFIPNTSVKLKSALVGGLLAGSLWGSAGFLFTSTVAASTKYTAIYSSFAILIIFMIWVYINWLILLVGAQLVFYHQNPGFLRPGRQTIALTNTQREHLAMTVMCLIGEEFLHDRPRWSTDGLASYVGLPGMALGPTLQALEGHSLLVRTEQGRYVPGRDMGTIRLRTILEVARSNVTAGRIDGPTDANRVAAVMASVEHAMDQALGDRTLLDLLTERDPGTEAESTSQPDEAHNAAS